MTRTMRALEQRSLEGPRGLHLVHDAPIPVPGPGQVLVRVRAAGVNFVDLARARGTFGDQPRPPFIAGFEAAGEVDGAVVVGAGPGAFAEYAVLPAAIPVPPGWTAEQALGLAINWPTALAVLALGRLAAGETVVVHAAAGATGQAAVTLARHRGARVIAVASAAKHTAIRADHVLDAREPALATAIRELTGGHGADLVLESAGGATFAASLAATRRVTGRIVVYGLAGGEAALTNQALVYEHPVQVIGFNLGALIRTPLFGKIVGELGALIAANIVQPATVTRYPLAEGATALAALESRATIGKLALIP